jgi:hypothetical protein
MECKSAKDLAKRQDIFLDRRNFFFLGGGFRTHICTAVKFLSIYEGKIKAQEYST